MMRFQRSSRKLVNIALNAFPTRVPNAFQRNLQPSRILAIQFRALSTNKEEKKESENLQDTLKDINNKYADEKEKAKEQSESKGEDVFKPPQPSTFSNAFHWIRDTTYSVVDNIRNAYDELTGEEKETALKRTLQQASTYKPPKKKEETEGSEEEEEEKAPSGPSAIVVVKEGKSAWDQMKERLQDSPLIREMLKRSKKVGQAAAGTDIGKKAQDIGQNVKDKVSDLREFWETSQNPVVYTLSGIWENVTGETEEGLATTALRRLDPKFVKEEWAEEVRTKLAPMIIKAQLEGDLKTLKPWCGEAVYNKLAAEIRLRKSESITFDSNILNIDENAIIMKILDDDRPIIVVVYMVQQINCIRKKGEIIEGSETDIRAKFYSMAFHQLYDEDTHEISWQIVDYEFAGDIPYY